MATSKRLCRLLTIDEFILRNGHVKLNCPLFMINASSIVFVSAIIFYFYTVLNRLSFFRRYSRRDLPSGATFQQRHTWPSPPFVHMPISGRPLLGA